MQRIRAARWHAYGAGPNLLKKHFRRGLSQGERRDEPSNHPRVGMCNNKIARCVAAAYGATFDTRSLGSSERTMESGSARACGKLKAHLHWVIRADECSGTQRTAKFQYGSLIPPRLKPHARLLHRPPPRVSELVGDAVAERVAVQTR